MKDQSATQHNTPVSVHPGDILIASPLLRDPNFKHTVILILDRDEDKGFIGLVLNRKLDISLDDLYEGESEQSGLPVYNGGPVDLQRLFWLHTFGNEIKGAHEVLPGICVGGSLAEVRDQARANKANKPEDINLRFYLGYSGWEKGQLEKEIESGAWAVNPISSPEYILNTDPDAMWTQQVKALGPSCRHWLLMPADPSFN